MGGRIAKSELVMADLLCLIRQSFAAIGQERYPLAWLTFLQIKASGKPPKLKAKASECRHLLECIPHMFQVYLPPKSTHDETRLNMLVHYRDMYRHLVDWTPENPLQFEVARAGRRAMILYGELAAESYAAGNGLALTFWRPTPKFHMFWECLETQVSVARSPLECWCYLDESMIGDITHVASSVHPSHVQKATMVKMRIDG